MAFTNSHVFVFKHAYNTFWCSRYKVGKSADPIIILSGESETPIDKSGFKLERFFDETTILDLSGKNLYKKV